MNNKKKVLLFVIILVIILNIFYYKSFDRDDISVNKKLKETDEEQLLDVFLIPHSHCDSGWLTTYDGYYYHKVQHIISGIVGELNSDPTRKFNWGEIGFFSRWYDDQNESNREIAKRLIENGQLYFIGGGWVQNDEAVASVDDVITQMTQGHIWLRDNLNVSIEYAWQIDPFGYSSSTPTIFSKMGIKGLIINRVSNDVKQYMKDEKEMEFIWKGSESLGQDSEILVSTLNIHYDYPKMIDPQKDFKLKDRVSGFAKYLKDLSKTRNSNILMIPLGDDFRYTDAPSEFRASKEWLEIMQQNKQHYNIKEIRYATLNEYFEALEKSFKNKNSPSILSLYNKDFFPYTTEDLEYWTGYYSTRPILKKLIRDTSLLQKASDILYSLAMALNSNNKNSLESLNALKIKNEENRNEVSLMQHHDIITGTSRSFVLRDNFNRLQVTRVSTYNVLSNSVEYILNNNNENSGQESDNVFNYENVIDLSKSSSSSLYSLVFHNPLGWSVNQHVTIRVKGSTSIVKNIEIIEASTKDTLPIQVIPVQYDSACQSNDNNFIIFTIIKLPALGLNTYYLKINNGESTSKSIISKSNILKSAKDITFSSSKYDIEFNSNGLISKITDIKSKTTKSIKQSFNQYSTTKSGPYIFNTVGGKKREFLNKPDKIIYYDGPVVSQLTMVYGIEDQCNVTSMVIQRIYKNPNSNDDEFSTNSENYIETSYSILGNMNKESTANFKILDFNKDNGNVFYTDNGFESRKRIYDTSKTENQNYYPALHYLKLKDDDKNQQFTIYVDRSVGVTSPSNGELEAMIHRTMDTDDFKGVKWPSKDTARSDGKIYFNFDSIDNQKNNEKRISLQINNSPVLLVKIIQNLDNYESNYKLNYSPLTSDLPSNIHLHTLVTFSDDTVGLRLFNIHETINENTNYLSDKTLFKDLEIKQLQETGLSFMELKPNNVIIKKFETKIDSKFPIKCGESEYSFINEKPSSISFLGKIINEQEEQEVQSNEIKALDIKSFSLKLNNNNNNNQHSITNNNIKFNSQIKSISAESKRYAYDFSYFPITPTYYNDIGNYVRPNHLALILSLSIGIPVALLSLITAFIIYRKRKLRKSSSPTLSSVNENLINHNNNNDYDSTINSPI